MPKPSVRTNEREWQGKILELLNNYLVSPFTLATQEAGVDGKFPDIVIWTDRSAGIGAVVVELKTLETDARDPELLMAGLSKAHGVGGNYVVTWNMRDTIVWHTSGSSSATEVWTYPPIPISTTEAWLSLQQLFAERCRELVVELAEHYRRGAPPRRLKPETTHFVETVFNTVQRLVPLYQQLLPTADRRSLVRWASEQQIPLDDGYATAARHVVYRQLVKMLFYHSLSQFRGDLQPLVGLEGASPSEFQSILANRFERVRDIDYEAVFEPRFADRLPLSELITSELKVFCKVLNELNLNRMSIDVIGHLFEAIIPEDSKKQLGQFFTEDRVADLLVSFAMSSPSHTVFDPTCGTGGVILRALSFLKYLDRTITHKELLTRIWGNDISDFPVELATVNLFRQDPSVIDEFPRITHKDFFELSPGMPVYLTPARRITHQARIEVALPQFDAVVGNPPYVRRQSIGDWTLRPEAYRRRLWRDFPEITNHQTDYYAFVFLHALRFLRERGRLAFITSNAWLESEYGFQLQKIFLRDYRLIAILESRCEAWFDKARVNTVVTVLEAPPKGAALGGLGRMKARSPAPASPLVDHKVKFVKLKRPLAELMPGAPSDLGRFHHYLELVNRVEDAATSFEDDSLRVRCVSQSALLQDMPSHAHINKWGHYLRAPDSFEAVLSLHRSKLVSLEQLLDVRFGTLTGWNQFYCPRSNEPGFSTLRRVEDRYVVPLIRSSKDIPGFVVQRAHCRGRLFVCADKRSALRGTATLAHVKWGEKQSDENGQLVHRTGEMANRNPWYRTRKPVRGDVIFQMFIGDRHFCPSNPKRFAITNNLLAGTFRNRDHVEPGQALLNSLWFYLMCELYGRVNLGEGALKIEKIDLDVMPLPSLQGLIEQGHAQRLVRAFAEMAKRDPEPISEEIRQPDRRDLDEAVFDFLDLRPSQRQELREAVVQLAQERAKVAQARKFQQEKRVAVDTTLVLSEIKAEVIPDGLEPFPERFLPEGVRVRKIIVPGHGLRIVSAPRVKGQHHLFGGKAVYRIKAEGGYAIEVETLEEVCYIYHAQNGQQREVPIPNNVVHVRSAVRAYRNYLASVEAMLVQSIFARCRSHAKARVLSKEILRNEAASVEPLRVGRIVLGDVKAP